MLKIDLLLARRNPGDVLAARTAMPALETLAASLGADGRLRLLRERVEDFEEGNADPERVDPPIERRTQAIDTEVSIVRHGDFWVITLGTATTQIRDLKGLHQLVTLIREPEREFHVLDMLDPTRSVIPAEAQTGGWLDQRARNEYKARLSELRESLAEAERLGDSLRASYCQSKVEALAHELGRHVGLGGRDRPGPSSAERARVNVTRTIHQAIGRIDADLPELARHLRSAVQTGAYCSYDPGRDGASFRIRT
jgi:hypothetical protein